MNRISQYINALQELAEAVTAYNEINNLMETTGNPELDAVRLRMARVLESINDSRVTGERLTYTVPEAAKALSISTKHVYELIRQKQIPAIHMGRKVLIPAAKLRAMVDNAGLPQKD